MSTFSPSHPRQPEAGTLSPAHLASVRGIVFDIQRMSWHDGPGVRTNVFLKGCPLACGWCANPESQQMHPELMLHAANCIECGQFAPSCRSVGVLACSPGAQTSSSAGRGEQAGTPTLRVDLCPTGALHWAGAWRTAGEVMAEVRRDRPFYGAEGGLTLTGGEPAMQPAMCEALLRLAREEDIHTAMETCGQTQWAVYERLLPWLDVVLFDVKHVDPDVHRRYTGVDNRLILDNLRRLAEAGTNLRVRVPLIPGFNAHSEVIAAIAGLVRALPGPVAGIDLLPYHTLGQAKYAALGRAYPWDGCARLSEAEIAACTAVLHDCGLPCTVGG